MAIEQLAALGYGTFMVAMAVPGGTGSAWEQTVRAVATEVLSDPARWARELGLFDSPALAMYEQLVRLASAYQSAQVLGLDVWIRGTALERSLIDSIATLKLPTTAHQAAPDVM